MMSGPLRSKQGCWTCRLRRKKCDERRDPEWMDGGERERAMANSIKQIVKHTSRKKGRLGTTLSRFRKSHADQEKGGGVALAPKSINVTVGTGSGGDSLEPTGSETSPAPSADTGTKSSASERNQSSSPSANQEYNSPHTEMIVVSRNETVLLMHFLDHVFPLQHPMYKPQIAEGGRSWLLSLLLRTKPLYHASLALSAYHRGNILLASQRCVAHHSMVEQEKHLAICLEEFQEAIKNVGQMVMLRACPKDSLGLMASVVQLIYFELFAGHGNAWQIHLRAATTTLMQGYWNQSSELGMLDPTAASLLPPVWEGQPNENVTSFKFLSGVIIWLDLLDCITSGKAPGLLTIHSHALSPGSHIRMETIIGSSNWVILQIARIAALHEKKVQLLQTGCFGCETQRAEFDRNVDEIRHELQCGLTEQALLCLQVHSEPVAPADTSLHNQAIVTRLFALAASIYLYLVVQGSHQEAGPLAEEAMIILRTQMPRDLMHVIIFPLYIIGYVVSPDDQSFFRCAFSATPVLEPSLEHRSKILPLLEEAWLAREEALDGGGWQRSLNRLSESNILLL
ncbi:hypothetical protein IFR04_000225 [Cadophora malorum]|uniref:Zn(2)-C6 fungal-type domain-containing protein n=1 Tax=Cadophora malorum TaxID=108018 RepID=A0A8H7WKZ2_9HELO|nr:hypothetical protein IFR04_000225 [Cadophora malorum]